MKPSILRMVGVVTLAALALQSASPMAEVYAFSFAQSGRTLSLRNPAFGHEALVERALAALGYSLAPKNHDFFQEVPRTDSSMAVRPLAVREPAHAAEALKMLIAAKSSALHSLEDY